MIARICGGILEPLCPTLYNGFHEPGVTIFNIIYSTTA